MVPAPLEARVSGRLRLLRIWPLRSFQVDTGGLA